MKPEFEEVSVHVAGDIVQTHSAGITSALSGLWGFSTKDEDEDEMRLRSEVFSFSIYVRTDQPYGKQRDYLVSGSIRGGLEQARVVVEEMAKRLKDEGIVYNFELQKEQNPDNEVIIRHPDF